MRDRRGVALLEVMIALTVLLGAGVSLVALLGAALRSETAMKDREMRFEDLDRMLAAMSLLSRTDLDRRLGRHATEGVVTEVQRPEPTLYRIAVGADGSHERLVTVVYRPDERIR